MYQNLVRTSSLLLQLTLLTPSSSSSTENATTQVVEDGSISDRQLAEFTLLGKFKLGQIRSQLEYDTFFKNFELNQELYFDMAGIRTFEDTSENNSTKCYDGLGCLEFTENWYDLLSRPVNLFPLEREVINTEFLLITRSDSSPKKVNINSRKDVRRAGFVGRKPTKIIIHGFLDHGDVDWIKDMAAALLGAADVNVFVVDWRGGSLPMYSQAAANTRLVGLEVARLVNILQERHRLKPANVHIIGHSLGAHIAGYAGERIEGLGRISGLDPAEPLFQGMPAEVRLDHSDAMFVDVIHTDSKGFMKGGLGLEQPVGHVDFYPNGGKVQPGCSFLDFPYLPALDRLEEISLPPADSVARNLFACAHNRVIALYIDSILNQRRCPMVGHSCQDYQTFQAGQCYTCGEEGANCSVMGYGASKHPTWQGQPTQMFLDTDSEAPYCTFLYILQLDMANPREAEEWVQGYLKVTLLGEQGSLIDYDLTPGGESVKFFHPEKYKYPILSNTDLGKIYWDYDDEVKLFDLSRICIMFFCSKHLYTASVTVTSVGWRDKSSSQVAEEVLSLCSEEQAGLGFTEINSGSWETFYKDCSEKEQ